MSAGLARFVAAGPWPAPTLLRALLSLARRPRGSALLARLPRIQAPVHAALVLGRYDEPAVGRALAWDAEAVVARGRALRRAEGRP